MNWPHEFTIESSVAGITVVSLQAILEAQDANQLDETKRALLIRIANAYDAHQAAQPGSRTNVASVVSPSLLRFRNISKSYHKSGKRVQALADVSFSVAAGEVAALLGANGAGKTTLIKILSRVVLPDEGHVEINGMDTTRSPTLMAEVGVVMEGGHDLYDQLSALENVSYIAGLHGLRGERGRYAALRALRSFGLENEMSVQVRKLSRGMRQRVSLAASIVHDPRFIVLDEPTLGLDPKSLKDLKEIIAGFRVAGIGVLLATHHLEVVEEICSRAIILNDGSVRYDGPVKVVTDKTSARYEIRVTELSTEQIARIGTRNSITLFDEIAKIQCSADELFEVLACVSPAFVQSVTLQRSNLRELFDAHTS